MDGMIVNIIMRRQKQGLEQSDSRKRVKTVFEEEAALSKAFEVSNFYTNERLNIAELKHRLQLFKRSQQKPSSSDQFSTPQKIHNAIFNQPLPQDTEVELTQQQQQSASKFITSQLKQAITNKNLARPAENTPEKTRQRFLTEGKLRKDVQRREEVKQTNYRIVKEIRKGRYESKTKTAFATRHNLSAAPLDVLLRNVPAKNSREKMEYSKCSSNSLANSWVELGVEGRVFVQTQHQLRVLEGEILSQWEHYQLLTGVLLGLKEGRPEKAAIVKYIDDVCSQKFEFVLQIQAAIQRENPSKEEASFMKRLRKAVMLSKLYENLSIMYVSLLVSLHSQPDAHLVNFLGYCCSNAVFLLKFALLCHSLAHPLTFSSHTLEVLAVITEFQRESYRMQVERMGDLVLRVQHNNEVLAILQTRVCSKMGKDFQQTIATFLRPPEDPQPRALLQYAHYIFEFLAFHLARSGILGQFSPVEMAPSPYLSLPRQRTLVVQPWGVLFAMRGQNTYIRAYSQAFLSEIGKHWNIVYWTDVMPDKIDDLLTKLPKGEVLYRYHCRYEDERFVKLLWRVGCDLDNTIILDREEGNFRQDREMGAQLPWGGKSKDCRLVEALNLFLPLLASSSSTPLRKSFPAVKEQLASLDRKSRQRKRVVSKGGILKQRRGEEESMYPRLLFGK